LPILSELAAMMPAPFESGSNIAMVKDLQITYRLPETTKLGYLELFASPWNDDRAILAVLGTSNEGVAWAGNALATPALRGDLVGDFAYISGERIVSMDTQLELGGVGIIATTVPGADIEIPMPQTAPTIERPTWVLPVIAGGIVLMIIIVIVAGVTSLRKRS
jgi:hypothetical protein